MIVRLFLAALLAAPAPAQILTIEEAVARALETHPDLAALRASRAVALFQVQAARALPVPEFRVTMNNFSMDPEGLDLRNSIAWKWSPPRPRELSLKSRAAEARRRANEAEIQLAEKRVGAAVRMAYRRASIAQERLQLAERAVQVRENVLAVTRRQVANGLKEAVETDLAELAFAEGVAIRERTNAAAAAEHRKLTRLLDPEGRLRFSLAPETTPAGRWEGNELVERALQSRPELWQIGAACAQAEAAVSLAANGLYPWISSTQVTRRLGNDSGRTGSWGVQIGIELPLFRAPAQYEKRVASAAVSRCRLEERAARSRVKQEVEEAAAQWRAAMTEVEKLESLVTGPAARALDHVRAALAAGRADRAELLQAEVRQLTLRDRWLERRLDLTALELQLELAAGQ